jgi:DNA-binding CsgD family transcriptional regulator
VLETAGGNPLALLELPATLASGRGPVGSPTTVPLTARLEAAFASRAAELPAATRTLLRIAAADERATLAEVISAAEVAFGTRLTVEDLVPATDAQLIDLDVTELRFRHPLVSSAVYQAASVAERHAAHAALAKVLRDPDPQIRHRAAATVGTDPDVASELEAMARRVQKRGANIIAAAAFERAAVLTRDPAERAQLLLSAAEAAAELGRSEIVLHLVREAEAAELGLRERALAMSLVDGLEPGSVGDSARVSALVQVARERTRARDNDLALSLASSAAFRCYVGNLGEDSTHAVLDVADLIEVAPDDPRRLQILGYAAPIERGSAVIAHLPDSVPAGDPLLLCRIGTAASQVGAYERASPLLAAAAQLREQGRRRALAEVLLHRAWSAIQTADYTVAMPAAEEAERLASETAQPALQTAAWTAHAALAALRGEQGVVEELTEAVERASLPAGAAVVLALAQYARGLAALGQGLHEEGYEQLRRIYQPGDPSQHHQVGCYVIGDFTEAAIHSGHGDAAQRLLDELRPVAALTPSPFFHGSMRYAEALVANDADAEDRFLRALAHEQAPMPFLRARLQLALGQWLRRHRRVTDSRPLLRAARDAFDALGVHPWGERARHELRASGETSRRRAPHAVDELTPQELQIVELAADGLSNREIGQRLYLSHRTVESHLYRVFPKLGVTSRAQLAGALFDSLAASA